MPMVAGRSQEERMMDPGDWPFGAKFVFHE
jgi:hypothetical protein